MRVCVTLPSLWMTSASCVMGCFATMATGVSQVLHLDFLCSDHSVRFLVTHSLYCENAWKRDWEWQGEGGRKVMLATGTERLYNLISVGRRGVCPSVISERNGMFETGRSVVTPYSAVKHIRQEWEECRAVLVSSSIFYTCFMENNKRSTWVIRWLWRFFCLFLSCKLCFLIFLTVLCFCVYLIIKC